MPRDAADPVASRSGLLSALFTAYLRVFFFRRSFHALRLSLAGQPALPPGRPVILCVNHPSWWDPALFMMLMPALFRGRRGFGPMDARSLRRYALFRRMGVFGIEPDQADGAARFLRVGQRVLEDPRHMLWVTAEGGFTDPRRRPVRLRPGLAHLIRRVPEAVVVPVALEYAFWNERFPEALAYFGAPLDAGRGRSVADWTALLEARLQDAMEALASESIARDPRLFRILVRGRVGVGGIYDIARRLKAWSRGQAFDPSHEGVGP